MKILVSFFVNANMEDVKCILRLCYLLPVDCVSWAILGPHSLLYCPLFCVRMVCTAVVGLNVGGNWSDSVLVCMTFKEIPQVSSDSIVSSANISWRKACRVGVVGNRLFYMALEMNPGFRSLSLVW